MLSLCRCRRVHSEGAVFFSFLAGMLSQHGCTSRDRSRDVHPCCDKDDS